MKGHTPGSWTYGAKLSGSENHRGFYLTEGNFVLGELMPIDSDGEEGEANARLIAAAPDLLAVARRIAEHFDGTDAPLGAAARAAVAKAEGRQS